MLTNDFAAQIALAVVSYVAGIITGYFVRGTIKTKEFSQNQGNTLVLTVVTLIWAGSMLVDIVSPVYETSPLVHGLMGAIVGFFYKPIAKK